MAIPIKFQYLTFRHKNDLVLRFQKTNSKNCHHIAPVTQQCKNINNATNFQSSMDMEKARDTYKCSTMITKFPSNFITLRTQESLTSISQKSFQMNEPLTFIGLGV